MRKITSKEEGERKKKRNLLIIGGILIFVMLFSTFGYSFYKEEGNGNNINKKINYKGFDFVKQGDYWILNTNNINFFFRYNPKEVLKVYATLNPISNYYEQPLYIFSENKEAELEIYNNLGQVSLRIQPACLDESECEGGWPVKTCENNFIIIRNSNFTNIIQEDNCVFINSPEENLTQTTDEFLFKIIGVE